jgi:ribosomal-protein-alanine N-acetyltransferase
MREKNSCPFPRIETGRLVLRELSLADGHAIFHNFSDKDVTKWFFDRPYTELNQAKEIIREFEEKYRTGKGITWGITLKGHDVVIGTCGFETFELAGGGEIGFDLAKAYWGRGLMREALCAIIAYGFEHLLLRQVEAHTYSENATARALLERLGFSAQRVENGSCAYALNRENWIAELSTLHSDAVLVQRAETP